MKKLRRTTLIILATCLVLTNIVPAFASSFPDVPSNHWAKPYIDKVEKHRIITGTTDANLNVIFAPNNPVTKIESLQMIYKTLAATDRLKTSQSLKDKYKNTLDSYDIPSWSHEAVAYALEYNILNTLEISGLMSSGKQTTASRQQVAVYFGKVLDSSISSTTLPPLSFIDSETIGADAKPYVQLMVGHGIIRGDDNNRFNPRNTITRAEMAVLTAKTYDLLEDEKIVIEIPADKEPEKPKDEDKKITKKGKIEHIAIDTRTIFLRDENDEMFMYEIRSDADIIIDGRSRLINALSKDQKVSITLDSNDRIIKVEVNPKEDKIEGYVDSVLFGDLYDRIKVGNTTFKVYDDVEIEKDKKPISLADIKVDDAVTLYFSDDVATKIIVDNTYESFAGILESSVDFSRYPFRLTIRTVGSELKVLEIDDKATIRRDGKRADLEDLSKGDIVSVEVRDNTIEKIEATAMNKKQKEKGTIESITIGSRNMLTILNEDNELVTYEANNSTVVYINDERASIADLRQHYEVELRIENDIVTEIDAKKRAQYNTLGGEITTVRDSVNRIIVRNFDRNSSRYEDVPVYINRDTEIHVGNKIQTGIRYLARNDEVFIYGEYDGDDFIATKVIVLNLD